MAKEKKLRSYPYFLGLLGAMGIIVLAQVFVIADLFFQVIEYDVDAVSSVMSTCSEVVAGLYGITLTGYIFFADNFRDTSRDDESLYDAVQALLLRYNHMAGLISLITLVCIVLGEGIVLYGHNTFFSKTAYRLIVNETLLLFYCTFNFIIYFVISVLDPQKVSRISSQKKAKLSKSETPGSMEAFLGDWLAIEDRLYKIHEELVRTIRFVPGAGGKGKPRLIQSMENLRNYGKVSHGLWRKMDKLRQYHNLTLHDPSMTVSQEMCDLAREVRKELDA